VGHFTLPFGFFFSLRLSPQGVGDGIGRVWGLKNVQGQPFSYIYFTVD
jgi:hypothetical protein